MSAVAEMLGCQENGMLWQLLNQHIADGLLWQIPNQHLRCTSQRILSGAAC